MVESIKDIKDEILMQVEQDMHENGAGRIDKQMIDNIKDLAEAEKACWEAEYYRSVAEAMEDGAMGYDDGMNQSMGYGRRNRSGYEQGGRGGRSGYRRGYRGQQRDSMGRYSRRGYRGRYGHDDVMQDVKDLLMSADPQEQERIKAKLRQMADM